MQRSSQQVGKKMKVQCAKQHMEVVKPLLPLEVPTASNQGTVTYDIWTHIAALHELQQIFGHNLISNSMGISWIWAESPWITNREPWQ